MNNTIEEFPRPVLMDRVVITDPKNSFYGQAGVLVHMPNDSLRQLRALVIPDSNTRAQAAVDQLQIVQERFASQLNLKARKEAIADLPEVEVVPALVQAQGPVTPRVIQAPKAPKEPKAEGGRRGRARTTVEVTKEIGDAAIAEYLKGKGLTVLMKEFNVQQIELSDYLKANGVVLKKGRRAA